MPVSVGSICHFQKMTYEQRESTELAISQCNTHHLRELQVVIDRDHNRHAARMMRLLQFSWHISKGFRKVGMAAIPDLVLERIERLYQQILAHGLREEEAFMERRRQYLKSKKVRRTKAYNLFRRLRDYQAETLRFLVDSRVPFDNNGSERDVRMGKLKAKISGCFRSKTGAASFGRIRCLST